MLRNTRDGNELALPATNALEKEHSVGDCYTVYCSRTVPVGVQGKHACWAQVRGMTSYSSLELDQVAAS